MRSDDDIGKRTQGTVGRNRLRVADINRSPGKMSRLQRRDKGSRLDKIAPSQIDQHGSGFHPRDGGRVEKFFRLGRRRTVQRHDVRLRQKVIQPDRFATGISNDLGWNEGVEHQPPTFERSQSRCDFTPDATEADDPHGLIAQGSQLIKRRSQPPFSVANMQRVRNHLSCGAQ